VLLLLVVKFVIVGVAEAETEDMNMSVAFVPAAAELVMVDALSVVQMMSILQVSPTVKTWRW
jgi:hypothetical protein